MREPLVALMSPRHPLAGKARVSLAESLAYPIALPLKNSGSRVLIDIACKAAGIYMMPVLETNSIQLRCSSCTSTTASPSIRACRRPTA